MQTDGANFRSIKDQQFVFAKNLPQPRWFAFNPESNMTLKTKRIINAAIWAVIAITLIIAVCVEWHKQGCGTQSLIIGALFYLSACTCFCGVIDQTIKERNEYNF